MAQGHDGGTPPSDAHSHRGEAAPVFKPPRAPFLDVLGRLSQKRPVVLEAIREDNAGRDVITEAHASYVRIKVADECVVRYETVGDMLGRTVTRGDIEANMPSFAGFIRTEPDGLHFVARQGAAL